LQLLGSFEKLKGANSPIIRAQDNVKEKKNRILIAQRQEP